MQVLPRWRSILVLRDSFIKSTMTTPAQLAPFHYTPNLSDKRKEKKSFNNKSSEQPSKKYIRFEVRQKRADAKRALKDILYKGYSKFTLEDYSQQVDGRMNWNAEYRDDSYSSVKKSRHKSGGQCSSKARSKRMRRKFNRESDSDDDNHENIFQATFGNRSYTWSYKAWEEAYSQRTPNGFEWRENSRNRDWRNESDMESDDELNAVGSASERTTLGLSPNGPLNLEDVKKAFRSSALKWHPDKHQGPSKVVAENKFKLCVSAYKSLCSALSPS